MGILSAYAARQDGFAGLSGSRGTPKTDGRASGVRTGPPGNGAGRPGRRKGLAVMKVGVPKEVKNHEYRVAITPAGVHELARAGHEVFIEQDAGTGSAIPDDDFVDRRGDDPAHRRRRVDRRANWCSRSRSRWPRSTTGCARGRCCSPTCTWPRRGSAPTRCSARASPRSPTRPSRRRTASLPLLAPMSEVAGRMAPQVGAHHLQRDGGGRGRADGRRVRCIRGQGGGARRRACRA